MSTALLRAKWVAPMDRPIIANGGIVIDGGLITQVSDARDLRGDRVEDFGDAIILPGLVNAHTHLELTAFSCGERPVSFVEWLKRRIPTADLTREQIRDNIERPMQILRADRSNSELCVEPLHEAGQEGVAFCHIADARQP